MPMFPQDAGLHDCERCGAKPCEAGRPGPSLITLTKRAYRVICLNCLNKSPICSSPKKAKGAWNGEKDAMPLSKRLRAAREALGVSQAKLADMAGVHPETIFRAESGKVKPTEKSLSKICPVLGLEI